MEVNRFGKLAAVVLIGAITSMSRIWAACGCDQDGITKVTVTIEGIKRAIAKSSVEEITLTAESPIRSLKIRLKDGNPDLVTVSGEFDDDTHRCDTASVHIAGCGLRFNPGEDSGEYFHESWQASGRVEDQPQLVGLVNVTTTVSLPEDDGRGDGSGGGHGSFGGGSGSAAGSSGGGREAGSSGYSFGQPALMMITGDVSGVTIETADHAVRSQIPLGYDTVSVEGRYRSMGSLQLYYEMGLSSLSLNHFRVSSRGFDEDNPTDSDNEVYWTTDTGSPRILVAPEGALRVTNITEGVAAEMFARADFNPTTGVIDSGATPISTYRFERESGGKVIISKWLKKPATGNPTEVETFEMVGQTFVEEAGGIRTTTKVDDDLGGVNFTGNVSDDESLIRSAARTVTRSQYDLDAPGNPAISHTIEKYGYIPEREFDPDTLTLGSVIINIREVRKLLHHDLDGDKSRDEETEPYEEWVYYGESPLSAADYGLLGDLKYHRSDDDSWSFHGIESSRGTITRVIYRPWGDTAPPPNPGAVDRVSLATIPAGISGPVRKIEQITEIAPNTFKTRTEESYIDNSPGTKYFFGSSSSSSMAGQQDTLTKEYSGTWTSGSGNAWTEFSDVTPLKPHRVTVTTHGTKDMSAVPNYDLNFRVIPGYSHQVIEVYGQSGIILRETRILPSSAPATLLNESHFEPATRETFFYDGQYRLIEVKKDGRTTSTYQYLTENSRSETNESGTTTVSVWDRQGRLVSSKVMAGGGMADMTTTYEYYGPETRVRLNGVLVSRVLNDLAGRTLEQEDQTGGLTTWAYANHGRTVTMTRADTATEITTRFRDGELASITGTGVVPVYYTYSVQTSPVGYVVTETQGESSSPRQRITIRDGIGRVAQVITSNAATGAVDVVAEYAVSINEDRGSSFARRKVLGSPAVGGTVRYLATESFSRSPGGKMGMHVVSGKVADWFVNPIGGSRLSDTHTFYEKTGAYWWRKTVTRQGIEDAASTVESSVKERLWQGDGRQTVSVSPDGEVITTSTVFNRATGVTTVTADSSRTSVDQVTTVVNGHVQTVQGRHSSNPDHTAAYFYDGLGRVIETRDQRGGRTRTIYNSVGQVARTIDTLGRITQYTYVAPGHFGAGQVGMVTNPDGKTTLYTYDGRGNIFTIRGSAEYPQTFTYNGYGERETLTTTNAAGNSVTRWEYNNAGLVSRKYHGWTSGSSPADPGVVNYVYDAFGRLTEKSVVGGKITSYTYNVFDEVETIDYGKDGADVTLTRNAAGKVITAAENFEDAGGAAVGSGSATYVYAAGRLDSVTYDGGHSYLPNVKLDYKTPDGTGRPTGYQVLQSSTNRLDVTYAYDTVGRLGSVTGLHASTPFAAATYSYHPGSGIVSGYTIASSSTTVLSQNRAVDFRGRISSVTNRNGSNQILASVGYSYDMADRRTQARREDGTYWNYGYNPRGEVTEAVRRTAGGVAISGLERQYEYDDIGNRKWSVAGTGYTDATITGVPHSSYQVNGANEYTSVGTPGKAWIVGRAPLGDTVQVNSAVAGRQDTWFSHELTVANSGGPVKQAVTVEDAASNEIDSGDIEVRQGSVSKLAGTLKYDAAGNLEKDGRWDYEWDSENRLRKMTATTAATTAGFPNQVVEFVYDWQGKRIAKKVTEGATVRHTRYLYEEWNVVAEWTLHGSSTTLLTPQTYLWGLDLAGQNSGDVAQLQAAGGVGGLLAVDVRKVSDASSAGKLYASYDGNGNILAWSASDGTIKRSQDYDAFGNVVLRHTDSGGPLAASQGELGYGFSTKPEEAESGLLYYGYRYYDPLTGRWPSKDPLGDEAFFQQYVQKETINLNIVNGENKIQELRNQTYGNLYAFLGNDGLNKVDKLGLCECPCVSPWTGDLWGAVLGFIIAGITFEGSLTCYTSTGETKSADVVIRGGGFGWGWAGGVSSFSFKGKCKEDLLGQTGTFWYGAYGVAGGGMDGLGVGGVWIWANVYHVK